jgi:hypothetical protein
MDFSAKAAAMAASMAAKQPTAEVKPAVMPIKQQEIPMAIHTPEAVIMVYGCELMDKRSIDILSACYNETIWETAAPHGVRMIRFLGDGRPTNAEGKQIYANCSIELGGITINLEHTFNKAVEMCMTNTETSIWTMYNQILIQSYLHEACHIAARVDEENRKKLDSGNIKDEEADCEKWSFDTLVKMAKTMNIEPSNYMENVYFSMAWAMFLETTKGQKDEWIEKQKHMLLNNISFKLEPVEGKHIGLELNTFKSFIQLSSDDQDSEEWDRPTINAPSLAQTINKAANTITQPMAQPYQVMEGGFANTEYDYMPTDDFSGNETINGFAGTGAYAQANTAFTPPQQNQGGFAPFNPSAATQGNGFNRDQAMAQTPVQQPVQIQQNLVYPPTGHTPEQVGAIVKGVYEKMYQTMFGVCGQLLNNDVGFSYPEGVVTVPIQLTPEEMVIIVKCECMDMTGQLQRNVPTSDGLLRGYISSKIKIPMYKIYINNNGYEDIRTIMPQNVSKSNAGQLSKPAADARAGAQIMYVIEGDDRKAEATGKKWIIKRVNNEWMAC